MRKLNVSNCTIVAAILLLIGCETDRREADINADTTAIKIVSEKAAEAWTAGDWNTFAGFYTDDTIWMPPVTRMRVIPPIRRIAEANLSEKLTRLVDDSTLLLEMKKNCLSEAPNFHSDEVMKILIDDLRNSS